MLWNETPVIVGAVLRHIQRWLVLPVVVAARDDRARFHPDDLSAELEVEHFERCLHFGGVQP